MIVIQAYCLRQQHRQRHHWPQMLGPVTTKFPPRAPRRRTLKDSGQAALTVIHILIFIRPTKQASKCLRMTATIAHEGLDGLKTTSRIPLSASSDMSTSSSPHCSRLSWAPLHSDQSTTAEHNGTRDRVQPRRIAPGSERCKTSRIARKRPKSGTIRC